ncbi:MAG: pyridoxal-phosphate dependent enzyme [Muribaculaceae bacterium]|nr:pyridoxal-phosphate dependent enzyme [Muribaculaceae bacterium]
MCQFLILDDTLIDGRQIKLVRDDLFPCVGGGNKARKSIFYEKFMQDNGYNACVTTGGIQSNHNRAIALMCARNGWKCKLVYHGTKERFATEKGNALLVRKTAADLQFVEANGIGYAMDTAMEKLTIEGYKPLYIHGGGHDLAGGIAFVEAVKELKNIGDTHGYKPDYIFHASGTGSTQAGIAVGLDLVGWSDVRLIGISVARQKERGTQVVEDFAHLLARHYGLEKDYSGQINFNTDYLYGGYEHFSLEMEKYLDKAMAETGIMFDTTYSGKAFYGMMDFLEKNQIKGNVLFWHTGGIMNMQK